MCWFVPVSHWNRGVKVDRMVCEVQIQVIESVHGKKFSEQHARYLKYRDWMGR
eukprot:CAMPEP_0172003542 /NCGR_PEP_ID=MMETSP1041-20130122/3994_1 /TAXON_ID=464988 /ORGANISM="Hemiselmis andersenii, Strain CCMP439" /LENGTH=52 /DNA_ID=CAMNT_0012657327 /DNA_START=1 /DNA_END=159 /DNA_ORIENTATION=-